MISLNLTSDQESVARRFLEAEFSSTNTREDGLTSCARSLLGEIIASRVHEGCNAIESEESMVNSPTPTVNSPSLLSPQAFSTGM